jgi:hypothetical protein
MSGEALHGDALDSYHLFTPKLGNNANSLIIQKYVNAELNIKDQFLFPPLINV